MEFNKFKDFLPITTILLVAFYVLTFFVKLGEMFYFGYPFSLFKFGISDALLYSVRTIPVIISCLIFGYSIELILIKFKKPKKVLFFLEVFIGLLFASLIIAALLAKKITYISKNFDLIFETNELLIFSIFGLIAIGGAYWNERIQPTEKEKTLNFLCSWFVFHFLFIIVTAMYGQLHAILTILISFSMTLCFFKIAKFFYQNTFSNQANYSSYKLKLSDYVFIFLFCPLTAAFFYGYIFYQLPTISFAKLNNNGVVVAHIDNNLIVRFCQDSNITFKIISQNELDTTFTSSYLSHKDKLEFINCNIETKSKDTKP